MAKRSDPKTSGGFVDDLDLRTFDVVDLVALANQAAKADPSWTERVLVARRPCRVSCEAGLMVVQAGDVIREPWRIDALKADTVNFALVLAPSSAAVDALALRLQADRLAVANLATTYGCDQGRRR